MKHRSLLIVAALALAACGSGSSSTSTSPISVATPTTPGATIAPGAATWGGPGGALDPRTTSGCQLLTADQMATITGDVTSAYDNYSADPSAGAGCSWTGSNGRTMQFVIPFADDPATMGYLDEPSLQAGVGEKGIIYQAYQDKTGFPILEVSINGWYVRFDPLGGDAVAYTDEEVIAFARLFQGALVPRPADMTPPTSLPDPGLPGDSVLSVVAAIDAPAYLAGGATVSREHDPALACSHDGFLNVGYRLLAEPVAGFAPESLAVEVAAISGSGTYEGDIDVYALVSPQDGYSYLELLSSPATITWDEATLTATFSADDTFGNTITGSLTCVQG